MSAGIDAQKQKMVIDMTKLDQYFGSIWTNINIDVPFGA